MGKLTALYERGNYFYLEYNLIVRARTYSRDHRRTRLGRNHRSTLEVWRLTYTVKDELLRNKKVYFPGLDRYSMFALHAFGSLTWLGILPFGGELHGVTIATKRASQRRRRECSELRFVSRRFRPRSKKLALRRTKIAVDYFLKIDGIQGESTDAEHKGEISILSWSWGETQATVSGAGGGAGKVSMQDFRLSKAVDKASPKLFLACASAQRIKDAVLSCRKAGANQDFMSLTLSEVTVSSYEVVGNSGAVVDPTDQAVLHFAKIEFKYVEQKPDGSMGASTKTGWDVKNNKAA